ncbi:MAG: hypothetical protein OEZ06_08300 [Myxococcales bacterium]|nr:hypothetical protein [Myxococcales bacterium]
MVALLALPGPALAQAPQAPQPDSPAPVVVEEAAQGPSAEAEPEPEESQPAKSKSGDESGDVGPQPMAPGAEVAPALPAPASEAATGVQAAPPADEVSIEAAPEPTSEAAAAAPPPAVSQQGAEGAEQAGAAQGEEEAAAWQQNLTPPAAPFSLLLYAETALGQGTFVADENARNPLVAWSTSVLPGYRPTPRWAFGLLLTVSQEMTDSDLDTERQQLLLSDTQLRGRYEVTKIEALDLQVAAGLRFFLPTSLISQHQSLLFGSQARLNLIRIFGPVFATYTGAFRKNFHRYTSPVLGDVRDAPAAPVAPRIGGLEQLGGGEVAVAGNNVSFDILNQVSVGYSPFDELTLGLSYALANRFTYRSVPDDARTSPYAEPGRGQRDLQIGSVSASWTFSRRFVLALAMTTTGPIKQADNDGLRFPFYDFYSTAENLTTFALSFTYRELFGE